MNTPEETPQQPAQKKPSLLQVYGSILSGIFGVQSSKNRERDFAKGDPKQFAIVYISIVVAIVFTMITIVRIVLHNVAGG